MTKPKIPMTRRLLPAAALALVLSSTSLLAAPAAIQADADGLARKLATLADARDQQLITPADYAARRASLLDEYAGAAPRAATVSAAPRAPGAGVFGLRVFLRDSDPISGAVQSQPSIAFTRVTDAGFEIDGGAVVLDRTGRPVSGAPPAPLIAGVGGNRLLAGGKLQAVYELNSYIGPAKVTLSVVGSESVQTGAERITLVRVQLEGYGTSSINVMGAMNAPIKGQLLIEPQTGLVLAGDIRSRNANYQFKREIVSAQPL
jgi:hypothetical protein